jgi:predicted lipid-binding transport protein (Tim44 family)
LDSQLLTIVLIAVTGVLLFRLYTVLGRRTGNERPRSGFGRWGAPQPVPPTDKVAALPGQAAKDQTNDTPGDAIAQGLAAIRALDRTFDTDKFVAGARTAYEMILTAYSSSNRAVLKPLLSDEVFAAFDGAIGAREQRKEKVQFSFVGFKEAKIAQAGIKGRSGEITVQFDARFISATLDQNGKVVEGDATMVREVTDVWTFARDLRVRDPNWVLVATSGELA